MPGIPCQGEVWDRVKEGTKLLTILPEHLPLCRYKKNYTAFDFVLLLLVCTWRHGGHVGGQEQKHFSPLGTKLYFHVNFSRKYSCVLTPNMAALSRGCKPRIYWISILSENIDKKNCLSNIKPRTFIRHWLTKPNQFTRFKIILHSTGLCGGDLQT